MAKETTKEGRLFEPAFMAKNTAVSFILTLIFLLIGAAIMTGLSAPEWVADVLVTAISGLCVMWSGYLAAKHTKRRGILCGFFAGAIYITLLYVAGVLALGDMAFGKTAVLTILIDIACGVLGGMVGVNAKKKRKRQR